MQSTLLGLAIAVILALVAALVGPHFVDFGQYRSYFEAEASRLVGQPVRIAGKIDARLLPNPSVTLRGLRSHGLMAAHRSRRKRSASSSLWAR